MANLILKHRSPVAGADHESMHELPRLICALAQTMNPTNKFYVNVFISNYHISGTDAGSPLYDASSPLKFRQQADAMPTALPARIAFRKSASQIWAQCHKAGPEQRARGNSRPQISCRKKEIAQVMSAQTDLMKYHDKPMVLGLHHCPPKLVCTSATWEIRHGGGGGNLRNQPR